MRIIFFDPKRNNKIIGMTDGQKDTFSFPFIKTKIDYHSFKNLKVIKNKKNEYELKVIKG